MRENRWVWKGGFAKGMHLGNGIVEKVGEAEYGRLIEAGGRN